MRPVILLLGDQLFSDLSALPTDAPIFMQEDPGLARAHRHHQQKLVLFFSAMRHRASELIQQGREVTYVRYDSGNAPILDRLEALDPSQILTFKVADRPFRNSLKECFQDRLVEAESPMFLTSAETARGGSNRKMADFYMRQRKALNILVDPKGAPEGGQWSFDADNRKKIPRGVTAPPVTWVTPDSITQEVIELVSREFADHPGNARDFLWPVTAEATRAWFNQFLHERFASFGPYEDAISREQVTLWHSVISPMMNCGLITPAEIVRETRDFAEREQISLPSVEGFLRQIIGWREFIKLADEEYAHTGRDNDNFFEHNRGLAPCWWDGTTGLPPVDATIKSVLKLGWCHHIDRLMVLGAVMLMCEVAPKEAYSWFMNMFIDSAEWVMGPNVYGMSQFSDGGTFATKPYISGSSYILKMSDYPAGDWCEIWDGLYWGFISRHRSFFSKNPRTSQLVGGFDRLEETRRSRILAKAEEFRSRVTVPG